MVKTSSFISFAVLKIAIFGWYLWFSMLENKLLLISVTSSAQGVPRLVMTAQVVTIFVLNGCMGSAHKEFLV